MGFEWYHTGKEKITMACGCGKKRILKTQPQSLMSSSGNFDQKSLQEIEASPAQQMVMLEYVGSNMGTFSLNSKAARNIVYRFGNNNSHRVQAVLMEDARHFTGMNERGKPMFRIIPSGGVSNATDPTEFLGHAIAA